MGAELARGMTPPLAGGRRGHNKPAAAESLFRSVASPGGSGGNRAEEGTSFGSNPSTPRRGLDKGSSALPSATKEGEPRRPNTSGALGYLFIHQSILSVHLKV